MGVENGATRRISRAGNHAGLRDNLKRWAGPVMAGVLGLTAVAPTVEAAIQSPPPLVESSGPIPPLPASLVDTRDGGLKDSYSNPAIAPEVPANLTTMVVEDYVAAMNKAGISLNTEQILRAGLATKEITGVNKQKYMLATVNLDPDPAVKGETLEGKIITSYLNENAKGAIWRPFTLKSFTEMTGIQTGALTSGRRLQNPNYRKAFLDNYSMAVVDGVLWSDRANGDIRKPSFAAFEQAASTAKAQKIPAEFQHLVRDEWKWYPDSARNEHLAKETAEEILRNNIRIVMNNYKDTFSIWSVVNEAINGDGKGGFTSNPFYDAMGIDYVRVAFDEARKISPKATLIYNDFDLELDGTKRAQVHEFLQPLIDSKLVNGVGIQMHYDGSRPPDKAGVLQALKEIGSWGASLHITELDVDMTHFQGTAEEKLKAQAKIYNEMTAAFLESRYGKSISTFGFTDLTSLYGTDRSPEALTSSPLPFDSDYKPKAAHVAMLEAASEYLLK